MSTSFKTPIKGDVDITLKHYTLVLAESTIIFEDMYLTNYRVISFRLIAPKVASKFD